MRTAWMMLAVLAAAAPRAPAQDASPARSDLEARVDGYLRPLVDMGVFSGAVLLAKGGRVVVEAAYGDADLESKVPNEPSTRFKLMSCSKSITAVAVLRLAQAGKLDPSDRVGKHLPDWPAAWREVTIRQLLDHTSGIANLEQEWVVAAWAGSGRGLDVWKRLAGKLKDRTLDAQPGTRSSYSNFNYVLLGAVLEAASGRPYADVLRSEVLAPAGMEKTGFDDGSRRPGLSIGYFRDRNGAPVRSEQDMSMIQGAGGLFSTVGDLYRLDRALSGDTLLSGESRARMVAPLPAANGYACGWQVSRVQDRTCVHHSGGANGYVADFLRFPDDDACVVVLSNFAFAPAGRISNDLAGLLFGKEVRPAKRVSRTTLDRWSGIYAPQDPGRVLLVRRSGDVLALFDVHEGVERCGSRLLLPLADDLFRLPWTDETLRFTAGAGVRCERGGKVTTMERADPPVAAWREAVGEYVTEPAGEGPTRIEETDGGFLLKAPGTWPSELELLPLTGELAIALYSAEGGTLVHLERDSRGRVVGFRRQRNDGTAVRGVRRER